MSSMKTKLMEKLHSQAGESIAEVLIAVLISALALTMLAGMISSTVRMVNAGKEKMNTYYAENADLEIQGPSYDSTATVVISSNNEAEVTVSETVSGVKVYQNTTFGTTVYSYCK